MIKKETIKFLQKNKNLLAFSAGIDSTALFFLLLESGVEFDIAIVDYNLRDQSKQEVAYAKELANKYNKILYTKSVTLDSSNFEANARCERYKFFESIIKENSYTTLLTAHQLNDKLEWFLMQLSKGAGLVELIGLNEYEKRENYTIVKSLLDISKDELQEYLDKKDIKYFVDQSNYDTKYKRNLFRKKYANEMINEYKDGIKKSFLYLQNDINSLAKVDILYQEKELFVLQNIDDKNILIRYIDKIIKKLGYLLSKSQKDEILKNSEVVISNKIAISFSERLVYIAPYEKTPLDKKQKELFRVNKIPPKVRCYINNHNLDFDKLFSI
jgi:tRNA(Ile)-lysidine synthase